MALTQSRSLSLTIERDDWRENSACRDTDPDLFFPERGASTREAKDLPLRSSSRNGRLYWMWGLQWPAGSLFFRGSTSEPPGSTPGSG